MEQALASYFISVQKATPIPTAPWVGVTGASGISNFVVPPGFSNDNFPVGVSSGETVNVTPAGQSSGGSGGNTTVHVYIDGQEFKGMIRYQIDEVDRGR